MVNLSKGIHQSHSLVLMTCAGRRFRQLIKPQCNIEANGYIQSDKRFLPTELELLQINGLE